MHIHRIGDKSRSSMTHIEIPGLGFLPVNAFVLHAEQPVVIDSGLSTLDKDFVSALAQVLDPADVRWSLDHPPGPRPHRRFVEAPASRAGSPAGDHLPRPGDHVLRSGRSHLDRVFLPQPRPSPRRLGRIARSARLPPTTVRQSLPPPASSTTGQGLCSARTAPALRCHRLSWPRPPTYTAVGEDVRNFQLLWASVDSPWVHQVDPRGTVPRHG